MRAPRVGAAADATQGVARVVRLALVFALLAALPTGTASAQAPPGTARLTVTVVDTSGVVPGATVSARVAGGTTSEHAVTDGEGRAVFPSLAAGTYDVLAEFPGFANTGRRGVSLAPGAEQVLELQMSLVQFSSQVTVTTASRREQLLLDVADATVLIDRGQILDTGARTAKDLLVEQSGAGIQVQAGGGQGYVSINGVPNSGVLVLIDGRRYLGRDANGNLNLEDLTLSGVDRVEVVKGASSALYGSDALGGVINFITRRTTVPGVYATSTLSAGSYGDYRGAGALGWRGTRAGIGGSGGYRQYDGFDLSEANPQTIGQPESTWWNGDINADVKLGERIVARIFADQSNRDIDNYFFSGATQLPASVYNSQRTLIRQSVMPQFDVQVSPSTFLTASYTYGKYSRDETRIFTVGGRVVPQAPWREWNQELKVSGRHDWSAFGRQHPLQVGVERRDEQLRRGTLSVTDPERNINVLWFQQEVAVTSRLRLAAGVRYDDYSDFGSEWSPKTNAVFAVTDNHRVRASYGHGFRPPYFNELYLFTPPSFVGNPNLTPESSDTLNLGYAYSSPRVQVSLDLYQRRDSRRDHLRSQQAAVHLRQPARVRFARGERIDLGVAAGRLHAERLVHVQPSRRRCRQRDRRLREPQRHAEAPVAVVKARPPREHSWPGARRRSAGSGRHLPAGLLGVLRAGGQADQDPAGPRVQRLRTGRQPLRHARRVPAACRRIGRAGRVPDLARPAHVPGGRDDGSRLDALGVM